MADNFPFTPGSGAVGAADEIGGVLHQKVKFEWGPDGTANETDIASGKAMPAQIRSASGLIPLGEPTDAKNAATDTTSVSAISIWKQISEYLKSLLALWPTSLGAGGGLKIDGSGTALPVSGTVTVTGAGDASAANQAAGNASLASILAKIIAAPATEAKQDTGNTSLASILAKIIAAPATEAKQDSGITQATATASALGTTAGAAVITDANGTVQQYLRGLVKRWADALGAGTAAAALRTTSASDDPAVATLGATSGAAVITDANGTIQQYLRGIVVQWAAFLARIPAALSGGGALKVANVDSAGSEFDYTLPADVTQFLKTTTGLTLATLDTSASGDVTIVSATAGQTTRVHRMKIVAGAATVITIKRGSTVLDVFRADAVGFTIILRFDGYPWYVTAANEALVINNSVAVDLDGSIEYVKSA